MAIIAGLGGGVDNLTFTADGYFIQQNSDPITAKMVIVSYGKGGTGTSVSVASGTYKDHYTLSPSTGSSYTFGCEVFTDANALVFTPNNTMTIGHFN